MDNDKDYERDYDAEIKDERIHVEQLALCPRHSLPVNEQGICPKCVC